MSTAYYASEKNNQHLKQQTKGFSCFTVFFYWQTLLETAFFANYVVSVEKRIQSHDFFSFHTPYSLQILHNTGSKKVVCKVVTEVQYVKNRISGYTAKTTQNTHPRDIFSKTASASHTIRTFALLFDDCRNYLPDSGIRRKHAAAVERTGRSFYCCYPLPATAGGRSSAFHSQAPDGSSKAFYATDKRAVHPEGSAFGTASAAFGTRMQWRRNTRNSHGVTDSGRIRGSRCQDGIQRWIGFCEK